MNLPRSLALRQDAPPHLTISEPQNAFSSVYRIKTRTASGEAVGLFASWDGRPKETKVTVHPGQG